MQKHLDMEFGAAELVLDDELVQTAQLAGWAMYKESFNEDGSWCQRTTGTPEGAFMNMKYCKEDVDMACVQCSPGATAERRHNMILTPQRRSALIHELSLLTAESLLSIVKTAAANAATMHSTFGNPDDVRSSTAYNMLYVKCNDLLAEFDTECYG